MFNLIQRLSEDFQILDCCWEWITKYFHLMNEISYHWEIYMNLNSGLSTRAWKRVFFLNLHMNWPRTQTSFSGWLWISTRTVGILTQSTRISARLRFSRNRLVEFRRSRLFQMTTGTKQLPTRPTTKMILHVRLISIVKYAG